MLACSSKKVSQSASCPNMQKRQLPCSHLSFMLFLRARSAFPAHVVATGMSSRLGQLAPRALFSADASPPPPPSPPPPSPPQTSRDRLTALMKEYGKLALFTHIGLALVSLGTCYAVRVCACVCVWA